MIPPGCTLISCAYEMFKQLDEMQAFGSLQYLLVEGELPAFVYREAELKPLPSRYWWRLSDEQLYGIFKNGQLFIDYPEALWVEDYPQVVVRTGDLEMVLPREIGLGLSSQKPTGEGRENSKKGGRKPKYVELILVGVKLLWKADAKKYPDLGSLVDATVNQWELEGGKGTDLDDARKLLTSLYDIWKKELD